ncbi:MAG: hypothetical protein IAE93_05865 [Ignavibacteria bacterium]|nr:hypothetical protein [Ignavibacteria bacterium]
MIKQRLKKGEKQRINWNALVSDLVINCNQYHQYYYAINNFTGPSYHFHIRALKTQADEKIEMIYAMLVSWGMHRMGGGAQMNEYDIFYESITSVLDAIESLSLTKFKYITENEINQLKIVFNSINAMKTSRKIVAVSKVMAHFLPHLIAPIDNEYTFQFISQEPKNTNMPRNWNEFELFKEIHLNLFQKVIIDDKFKVLAAQWLDNPSYPWDTSIPKIVDNLIIGKIKHLKLTDVRYKKTNKNFNKL